MNSGGIKEDSGEIIVVLGGNNEDSGGIKVDSG